MTPLQKRLAELREMAEHHLDTYVCSTPHTREIANALLAMLPLVEAVYAYADSALDREREKESEMNDAIEECERVLTQQETAR